ncbi:winged helix-turn-helix transcriptional regulator [Candidatus Woesearchaeota archaeon]|nr:winged helix-turn-helix transcriptional regulator [Candidatus Woesearchaeota archaeon]
MDKIDTYLLRILMQDSRIPLTQLAKKLKVSREVATYRLNRLKKEGIILDFVTEINREKLGFVGAAVFVNVKATHQKRFKQFLAETPFVSWVAELSGVWSFGLSITAKTNAELDERFLQIYNTFKDAIIDHRFTLHRRSLFFYEKYFGASPKQRSNKQYKGYSIDNKDKIILKELAKNSRIGSVALSQKISLTAPAITKRMKQLEASGHIENYSLFVDISKLGLFQYSIFIINKNIDEKQKLINYLTQHTHVSFLAEYVGDPFLEFGLFVKDPYQLREKLQEIEENFPNNRVIEVSLFQKEFVSVGPPLCVFE